MLGSLYEGYCYFGSIADAPDFWKLQYIPLIRSCGSKDWRSTRNNHEAVASKGGGAAWSSFQISWSLTQVLLLSSIVYGPKYLTI